MNERIRELAEQAHIYACEYTQLPEYSDHNPYNQAIYKTRYDSKFAELIVRECIRVPYDMWDKAELNADIAVKIEHRIKEHFGVEE